MTEILLAAFNAGPYLAEQIKSILAQKDAGDFRLTIRDGGSTDGTQELIEGFQRRYPDRIFCAGSGRANARENFAALLEGCRADYIFFSDQDDIWLPDKMRLSLEKIKELERRRGKGTPLLVFSDAKVSDAEGKITASSMLREMNLDPRRIKFNQLILQNVPSGNTIVINKALRDLAAPIPEKAVMHDHYLALTAALFGEIGFLEQPTLLYRQHGGNYYGAFRYSVPYFLKKARGGRERILARLCENLDQAAVFLERHEGQMGEKERALLRDLTGFREKGFLEKRRIIFRHRLWKCGALRNLGMLLTI